jgi:hypothetical protein
MIVSHQDTKGIHKTSLIIRETYQIKRNAVCAQLLKPVASVSQESAKNLSKDLLIFLDLSGVSLAWRT